jgi:hypothetical protein
MNLWIEIPEMSIQRDMPAGMLEVNHISIAKGGNLDPMHPSIGYRIDGFALHASKLVIQTSVEVVGTEFGKVA